MNFKLLFSLVIISGALIFHSSCKKNSTCDNISISLETPKDSVFNSDNIKLTGSSSIKQGKNYWTRPNGQTSLGDNLSIDNIDISQSGKYTYTTEYADCVISKDFNLVVNKKMKVCVPTNKFITNDYTGAFSNVSFVSHAMGTEDRYYLVLSLSDNSECSSQKLTLTFYKSILEAAENSRLTESPAFVDYPSAVYLEYEYLNSYQQYYYDYCSSASGDITITKVGDYIYLNLCEIKLYSHSQYYDKSYSACIRLPVDSL